MQDDDIEGLRRHQRHAWGLRKLAGCRLQSKDLDSGKAREDDVKRCREVGVVRHVGGAPFDQR
jgi:hypothetical protein